MRGRGTGQETLTILVTEVEGSTAFRSRVGDDAGNQALSALDRLIVEQVVRHEGRPVKSLGDGHLAVFASPRRAVDCAVAMQRAAISSPLRVRIGLNAGEVAITDDDVFGSPVNAAARVANKAQGGEILVAEVVRQLMGSTVGLELRDRGRVRLRGFPERWRLYEVAWQEEPAGGMATEPVPFVGRAAEVARLHRVFGNLAAGHGAVVVIRGEAGIGKTRLASEALADAEERGWRVLTGRASPLGGGLGFEPIVDAFGGFLRTVDRSAAERVVLELPHLARLFEGIGVVPSAPLGDPALERTLLFESVARLLERVAADSPVILLIDDIQWADSGSLEVLHHLARGIGRQPAALVLTYRPHDHGENDRLRPLLVALRRLGVVEEIELDRLAPPMVELMASRFLGGRVPSRLVDTLLRAGGTPLYIEAFLRALVDRGRLSRAGDGWVLDEEPTDVPPAARDLLLERLEGLAAVPRRLVDLVALSGGALSHQVLAATGEFDEVALSNGVQRLVNSAVFVEEVGGSDVTYRLAHPLYCEVAANELPVISRRRGHAILAAALERADPNDLEGLARHYLEAGPGEHPSRALEVLAGAGEGAARRRAYPEAAGFLEAAVSLARREGPAEILPAFLEDLAAAKHGAGQTDAAVAAWTEALELRRSSGEAPAVSRIRQALGMAEFDRGRLVEARDHLEAAATLVDGGQETPQRADLHMARVTLLRRLGRPEELVQVAEELESVAAAINGPRAFAQAHYARASALVDTGRATEALDHGVQGLRWAREARDDAIAYRIHTVCCDACLTLGDHARLLQHTEEGFRLAGDLGVGILAGGAALYRGFWAVLTGALDEGMASSDEDMAVTRRFDNARISLTVLGMRAWLLALRGDLAEAEDLMAMARERYAPAMRGDRRGFGAVLLAEAHIALEQDDPERALAALTEIDESAAAFFWLVPLTEARARLGDAAGTRRVTDVLVALSPFMAAEAAYAEGILQLTAGRPDLAATPLSDGVTGFEQAGTPFYAARSRLALATALVPVDRAAATAEAERAHAGFERIGAKRYVERARRLLRELGVRPATARRPPARRSGLLSRRELEVARLVAQGLTNAEIAEELSVSVRTVTSHLDHIYTRLGISSRAALASHVATEHPEPAVRT